MQSDCPHCRALGYLACDRCDTPVFPHNVERARQLGISETLCGYCLPDEPEPEWLHMTRKQLREYQSEHG